MPSIHGERIFAGSAITTECPADHFALAVEFRDARAENRPEVDGPTFFPLKDDCPLTTFERIVFQIGEAL